MNTKSVVLICHNNEIWVPRERLFDEGLFAHFPERIELPHFVTLDLFSNFIAFLNKEPLKTAERIEDTENVLLLASIIGWECFGIAVAKQVIEPLLSPTTCMTALCIISRVKGKARAGTWIGGLLRTVMGRLARYLPVSGEQLIGELSVIQPKIAQEIVEKCIKYNFDERKFNILLTILRKVRAPLSLVQTIKLCKEGLLKSVGLKSTQMNILKTLNLQSLKNKETSPFKLNDIWWKFISRVELENGSKEIRIVLKIDHFEKPLTAKHILFIYLFSRAENHCPKESPQTYCIRLEPGRQINVGSIQLSLLQNKKKADFAISLNIDYKLSLLLTVLSQDNVPMQSLRQLGYPEREPVMEIKKQTRRVHASYEHAQFENQFERRFPGAQVNRVDAQSHNIDRAAPGKSRSILGLSKSHMNSSMYSAQRSNAVSKRLMEVALNELNINNFLK